MDPYLYPKTETLKNRANLRDPRELAAFEASATARRLRELRERPLPGAFDADHLRGYHHWIFQDVYPFAGEFRIVTLGKAPIVGELSQWFTPPERLNQEAARICQRLAQANHLQGLSRAEFAQQAAQLLADLNGLHPFREGNGRTQRMFLSDLAHQAGHELHFDVVSRERMGLASRQAMQGDVTMMARLLDEITDAARIEPLRRAIAFLESQQFKWNDVYMATTTPGQAYSGTLAGRAGDSFMLRSDRSTLLIGNTRDLDPAVHAGERRSFQATDRRQHVELPAATEADRQAGRESLAGRGIGAETIAPAAPVELIRAYQDLVTQQWRMVGVVLGERGVVFAAATELARAHPELDMVALTRAVEAARPGSIERLPGGWDLLWKGMEDALRQARDDEARQLEQATQPARMDTEHRSEPDHGYWDR